VDIAERARVEPVPGQPAERADRTQGWLQAVYLVLGTRVLLMAIAYAAGWYLAADGSAAPSVAMWDRWDGSILMRIARLGYTEAADPHATAFFPGFPLLLKPFAGSATAVLYAALLINAIASIVAVRYLLLLGEEDAGESGGRRAAVYLLLFPTAVFLIAPYSEALFLAGATGAFYFARRGSWALAAVPLAVATATRAAGLFLIVGLVCEFVRRRHEAADAVKAVAALVVGMAPMLAYFAYLMRIEGTPMAYLSAQRIGWSREFVGPVESLLQTWAAAMNGTAPTNWLLAWRFEIVAALIGVGFTIWAARKREWGYAAYMGTTMAALVTSTWYFSIPRMLLGLFPIYLVIASATLRRPVFHEVVMVSSGSLAVLGVVVFTQGAWFF
jgi:hypothetical protein